MTTIKARVNQTLNVRQGAPRLNAPIVGVLESGYMLDVFETKEAGDEFHFSNLWYKDVFNQLVSNHGLKKKRVSFVTTMSP